jgi:hypothetical protein
MNLTFKLNSLSRLHIRVVYLWQMVKGFRCILVGLQETTALCQHLTYSTVLADTCINVSLELVDRNTFGFHLIPGCRVVSSEDIADIKFVAR